MATRLESGKAIPSSWRPPVSIEDGWLDINGNPLTEAAKVTERFRRTNYGNLEIDVTVDDTKAYTRSWTVKVKQSLMLDTELIEFICLDRDAQHYVGK